MDETQSTITTSSYRVAEGGMEYVNIYSVKSIARLLEVLDGIMIRIGTSLEAKKTLEELSQEIRKKNSANVQKENKKPLLIILGNEESGISDIVKENCDELVIIPWAGMKEGKSNSIDSLNVAQASSILFYELTK